MFGWLMGKKRRDQELLESLMRAAAQGDNRAKIDRALASMEIVLPTEYDNTLYCVEASAEIVRLICEEAFDPIEEMVDSDDKFVAGIFSFVASNHLTRIVGAPFEVVASIVPISLFGEDYADEVASLADSYNAMSQQGRVVEAIGLNIAKWISQPNDGQMSKLVDLYHLCQEHA